MSLINSNSFLYKTVNGVQQFFSPLVNASTVVLKDGSKLEKDGKVYVDEAVNAETLGGKTPEYYTNPKNLLKNSNFIDPVNTVGMNATYNSNRKHAIDCWMLDNDLTATQTTEGIQLIGSKNDWWAGMVQRRIDRSNFIQGKTYTVAVHGRFENDFRLYIWQEDVADSVLAVDYLAACSEWKTYIVTFSVQNALPNGDVSFSISPDNSLTGKPTYIKWAALYEGVYSADNLPPYVYKGYAAELAECHRYFRSLFGNESYEYLYMGQAFSTTGGVIIVPIEIPMRITPTLTKSGTISVTNSAGNVDSTPVTSLSVAKAKDNAISLLYNASGQTTGQATILTKKSTSGYVYLSAEL